MHLENDKYKKLIKQLYEENKNFYDSEKGRGALRDLQQTFPNTWLYICELLQNAIDEGAKKIVFLVDGENLILEHDGNSFTYEDVKALCSRGVSHKGVSTVGFMGIGFKAVFRSFQKVEISSGYWRFYLNVPIVTGDFNDNHRLWLGAVLPVWNNLIAPPSKGMTCRFVFSERIEALESISDDLGHVLNEEGDILPLLARKGLTELIWNDKHWFLSINEEKIPPKKVFYITAKEKDIESKKQWIIFSKEYNPGRNAIKKFLEHRQINPSTEEEKREMYLEAQKPRTVEAFCELDDNGVPKLPQPGKTFAVLPVNLVLPVRIHIQADWLLITSRQDFIDLEKNEWHDEILNIIPTLIAEFLSWVIYKIGPQTPGWEKSFLILPDFSNKHGRLDSWFLNEHLKELFYTELENLPILPTYSERGIIKFIKPSEAIIIPEELDVFDNENWYPWLLFGDKIVSKSILQEQSVKSLRDIGFLKEIDPQLLCEHLGYNGISRWLEYFEEAHQTNALVNFLASLGALDERKEWASTEFVCVPTEAGSMSNRSSLRRLPGEWNILSQEKEINQLLKSFAGEESQLVYWPFWAEIQRIPSNKREWKAFLYLNKITAYKLDELTNMWMDSLPEVYNEDQGKYVLRFTCWVRSKQSQRVNFIRKVICVDSEGNLYFLPIEKALLTEPYSGSHRKRLFPNKPTISSIYLENDPFGGTRANWQSFFESGDFVPLGPFRLKRIIETYINNNKDLKERTKLDYIPLHRSSYANLQTKYGFSIKHNEYIIVDTNIPDKMLTAISEPGQFDFIIDIVRWMEENPQIFKRNNRVNLFYIPLGWSEYHKTELNVLPAWYRTLSDLSWVPVKDLALMLRPSEVLDKYDPARPDAPVANLSVELSSALKEVGIIFGNEIQSAPALIKLKLEGPNASLQRLNDILKEVIGKAKNNEISKEEIFHVLNETPLFPTTLEDKSERVPHYRIVLHAGRRPWRSDLGGWVYAIDNFPIGSQGRDIFEQVNKFFPFPETTTSSQALDSLLQVWNNEPELKEVSSWIPYAYDYIVEVITSNNSLSMRWNEALKKAKVYVQKSRKWLPLLGNDIYYEDQASLSWVREYGQVLIVTLGHFGSKRELAMEAAKLLGMEKLSNRFRNDIRVIGKKNVPKLWCTTLDELYKVVSEYKYDDEINNSLEIQLNAVKKLDKNPGIVHATELTIYFCDKNKIIGIKNCCAAFSEGKLYLKGNPLDFINDLIQILIEIWEIRHPILCGKIGILLTQIDNQEGFYKALNSLREYLGLKIIDLVEIDSSKEEISATNEINDNQSSNIPKINRNVPNANHNTTAQFKRGFKITNSIHTANIKKIKIDNRKKLQYTAKSREGKIKFYVTQLKNLLATTIEHSNLSKEIGTDTTLNNDTPTDNKYRIAVMKYEKIKGRFPEEKHQNQPGYDIVSYDKPPGSPNRKLLRYIEVKGRSGQWEEDGVVSLSRRQFLEAFNQSNNNGNDYWLYIVCESLDLSMIIIPIFNPAAHTSLFELRSDTWRWMAEEEYTI